MIGHCQNLVLSRNQITSVLTYRNAAEHGLASVMRFPIINTNKELSAFLDFPPEPKFSNYLHNSDLME